MPHPDWEDLTDFFDADEFATTAIITRGGTTVGEVLGIFDDPNQVARLGEYELDHDEPVFTCSEVAVANVRAGDEVEIEGTKYDLLKEPQRDGTGLSKLFLSSQNVVYNAAV